MPKIKVEEAPVRPSTRIPAPMNAPLLGEGRKKAKLGDAVGLTQFGVNLVRIPAGKWSSLRHYHSAEDEFVYILEGEAVLVTDEGEQVMRPGDCAGFPAGDANGHHLQNRTDQELVVLEVGSRRLSEDSVTYVDADLVLPKRGGEFHHKDGRPYSGTARDPSKVW